MAGPVYSGCFWVTLILLGHLWSNGWAGVLWVLLGDSTQGVEAKNHLGDVSGLEQIRGLEHFLVRHSVFLGCSQEGLHVLHQ